MITVGKLSRSLSAFLVLIAAFLAIAAWRVSQGARTDLVDLQPEATLELIRGDSAGLIPAPAWAVFRATGHEVPAGSSLADRLRMAGAYPVMGSRDASGQYQWHAILEDLQSGRQDTYKVGDPFEQYKIIRITADRVTLLGDSVEVTISPGLRQGDQSNMAATTAAAVDTAAAQPFTMTTNRFGRQVAEHRWEISREKLLEYVDEVKGDMLRVAALYSSLMPDYSQDRDILGYVLDMTGEQEFFETIGMRNGDIVRKVNSMNMTSQRRAEYFISEFMNDNLPTVVIDVERDGEMIKMIYLMDGTLVEEEPASDVPASETAQPVETPP